MKHLWLTITLSFASLTSIRADDLAQAGAHPVSVILGSWIDDQRDSREILWKCYLPKDATSPVPVVIYSHGGGGNRDTNEMLGRHLASHGIASLHIQHPGSDDVAVRTSPRSLKAVNSPKDSEPRFRDVHFVTKILSEPKKLGELSGKLDPDRVGIAGHSYGGLTAQVIAGQVIKDYDQKLALPKLKGAFILSPSPPREDYGEPETAFGKMLMPIFSLTGTADRPPDKAFTPKDRTELFQKAESVDRWLLVMEGASHFTLSGQKTRPRIAALIPGMEADPNLEKNHELMRIAAVAFWRTTLLQNQEAKKYLTEGEFNKRVGSRGKFEFQPGKKQ
jgi:predicted dienelactone hydrolase